MAGGGALVGVGDGAEIGPIPGVIGDRMVIIPPILDIGSNAQMGTGSHKLCHAIYDLSSRQFAIGEYLMVSGKDTKNKSK